MAYTLPTLEELTTRAQERHRAELNGTDAFLWPNTEYVFVKTVAGLVHLNFRYLEWIKRQRFATEADGDELDNHGRPWGITRKPATRATGNVIFTGTALQTILAGTVLQRSDGVQFTVLADVTLDAIGTATASVEAVDTGADGNTTAGAALTLVEQDAAITDISVDSVGLGAGTSSEDHESYRARILFRMRNPPRGGSRTDYVAWASSIAGVTRVWVEDLAYGPGTVAVWFMTDGSTTDGIPSATSAQDVTDFIDSVRPETARVIVKVPVAAPMSVSIQGIVPSETQQALIEAEIADVFRRRVSVSTVREPFTLRNSLLWQAVARIMGTTSHSIIVPADTVMPVGYIPTLNKICYV